ncbi:hypothetical protein GCM10027053_47650 [Intrasporangium mesophilum]
MPGSELEALASMPPKDREPASVSILSQWVRHAARKGKVAEPRLAWLVASAVVLGALQQITDEAGRPRFLVKGGTMLMLRLGATARPTKDVDGILRGEIHTFLKTLDEVLARGWAPLELSRTQVESITVPHLVVPPRRFDIKVAMKGKIWRSIRVEVSPDEGRATADAEFVELPSLKAVGLSAPDTLACLALRYQVAQKVHAATDPHEPPDELNDRARDIVDLLALLQFAESTGTPTAQEIADACHDIFAVRAERALTTGATPRTWPPRFTAHPHWAVDYARAAAAGGMKGLTLDRAVAELNGWVSKLSQGRSS